MNINTNLPNTPLPTRAGRPSATAYAPLGPKENFDKLRNDLKTYEYEEHDLDDVREELDKDRSAMEAALADLTRNRDPEPARDPLTGQCLRLPPAGRPNRPAGLLQARSRTLHRNAAGLFPPGKRDVYYSRRSAKRPQLRNETTTVSCRLGS